LLDKVIPVATEETVEQFDIVLNKPMVVNTWHKQSLSMLLVVKYSHALRHKPVSLILNVFDNICHVWW